MENKIFGTNPVTEALTANREIDRLLIQDGARHSRISKITALAKERKIPFQFVNKKKLDELTDGANHQGVLAFAAAHEYVSVSDILDYAKSLDEPPFIVIAEGLKDPHNLGSIIRTANAAGVHGVIIPKNRSVGACSLARRMSALPMPRP